LQDAGGPTSPDALRTGGLELEGVAIAALDDVHQALGLPAGREGLASVTRLEHCLSRDIDAAVDEVGGGTAGRGKKVFMPDLQSR
jgi:hypothetical protein